MAADRRIGCGGEQTYDPSWCGPEFSTSRAAAVWSLELVVIGGLSLNDEGGEHDEDEWRTGKKLKEARIPSLHFQRGL